MLQVKNTFEQTLTACRRKPLEMTDEGLASLCEHAYKSYTAFLASRSEPAADSATVPEPGPVSGSEPEPAANSVPVPEKGPVPEAALVSGSKPAADSVLVPEKGPVPEASDKKVRLSVFF